MSMELVMYDSVRLDSLYETIKDKIELVDIIDKKDITLDVCYDVNTIDGFFKDKDGIIHKQCAGWSLQALLHKGIDAGLSYTTSKPARHFRTVVNHMVNFLGVLSNEWAGAQAFSSMDVLLAPYIYYDEQNLIKKLSTEFDDIDKCKRLARRLIRTEVKQSLQEFFFHLNYPNRWGGQAPFSNITLDLKVPHDLADQVVTIGETVLYKDDGTELKYKDLQEYIDLFNEAFFSVYMQGDGKGKLFTFPVITINLTEYFFTDLNPKIRDLILEANAKYGATYFQNCINGYMSGRKLDEGDSRAMCCLHPDTLVEVLFDDSTEPCYVPIHSIITKDMMNEEDINYKVLTPTGFVKPKRAFRLKFQGQLIKIIADLCKKGKAELMVTPDHPQPIFQLDKQTLEFSKVITDACNISDKEPVYMMYKTELCQVQKVYHINYEGYVYDFELPTEDGLFYANNILTHNCRLQIDVKEMLSYSKGLFSGGDYVGSVGVVTLNMAVLGHIVKSYIDEHPNADQKSTLFKLLDRWMNIAAASLLKKRQQVIEYLQSGLYPFTYHYLPYKNFETHFLTIGYCGLHECLLNLGYKDGIVDKHGYELAKDILAHMNQRIDELKEQYNVLFNLEATPAEGASYRLAKTSKKHFPNIILGGDDETPFLTNSCHPPASHQGDFVFLTEHQNELQPLHSGGTVVHYYVGNNVSKETVYNFIKKIAYNTHLPYFTISTVLSFCPVHGTLPGAYEYCPYDHTEEELEKYGIEVDDMKRIKCERKGD